MRFYANKCYILSITNKRQKFYTRDVHMHHQFQHNPYLVDLDLKDLKLEDPRSILYTVY